MPARTKQPATWVELETDAESLTWTDSIGAMVPLEGGLFALNANYVQVCIADGSEPGAPKLLGTFKPQTTFRALHFFPEWTTLAVISDSFIELLDVSDPRKPKSRANFTYDVGHERALTFMGGDLYVTHENGVALLDLKTRQPKHLFDVPDDDFFKSYPTGLASHGGFLYVAGRDAGLSVYRRHADGSFELIRTVKKGYTPTTLQWWTPGEVLLMVGNEDVIAVDVTKPAAAKWGKSCKVKGVELESGLSVLDAKLGFVGGGKNLSRNTLVLATIDLSSPLVPVVTEAFSHKDKQCDFNSASVLRIGEQVFVGGTYLERLKVFTRG